MQIKLGTYAQKCLSRNQGQVDDGDKKPTKNFFLFTTFLMREPITVPRRHLNARKNCFFQAHTFLIHYEFEMSL